jgi:hypothetical protein
MKNLMTIAATLCLFACGDAELDPDAAPDEGPDAGAVWQPPDCSHSRPEKNDPRCYTDAGPPEMECGHTRPEKNDPACP